LTNAWILSSNAMKIDCGSQWRRYRGFSQRLETQLKGPTRQHSEKNEKWKWIRM